MLMKTRRKQRNAHPHPIRWVLLCIVVAIALIGYVSVNSVMNSIKEWTQNLPSVTDTTAFEYSSKTVVYANDNSTVLAEFYLQDQQPVTINQVNNYVLAGTVATEDERFYEHNGVDALGIARAFVNNFVGGDLEGASTITQQLVRNTLLSEEANDISLKRKVREADLALQMEKAYSKNEILMMYINTINYGDGCYGIEAAAQHYFQTSAADLTIAQAATLIGIPQSPTYNNPVNYPENCVKRRNVVLSRMLSYGCITQVEYDAAVASDLNLNLAPSKSEDGILKYPYFTSYVRDTLLEQLDYETVFEGGLTVYTTIDPTLQGYAEDVTNDMYGSLDDDIYLSLTCVEPSTGYVLAMIGGRDYYSNQFNLATSESGRQAGSSFKVFTLTAAIEQGISPKSTVDCSSRDTINGWSVENYAGYNYGIRSIESATWVSSNTGFAHLVTDENGVSPASVLEMANRLGVSGTHGFGAYPALTLGVAQVNTLKMASGYSTFANNGAHCDATCIKKVVDNTGATIIDNTNPQGKQVITKEVSYAVTQVLEGVVNYGTATDARLTNGQVSAGKTGTSEDWRDLWYVGYTPQYSVAVWAGADPERQMYEATWCKTVWREFMTLALDGKETKDFDTADSPKYDSIYNTLHSGSGSYISSTTTTDTGGGGTEADDSTYSENNEVTFSMS